MNRFVQSIPPILVAGIFIAVILGLGLWVFYPRPDGDLALQPSQIDEESEIFDPIEYLRNGSDLADLVQTTPDDTPLKNDPEDRIAIIYGNPTQPSQSTPSFSIVSSNQDDSASSDIVRRGDQFPATPGLPAPPPNGIPSGVASFQQRAENLPPSTIAGASRETGTQRAATTSRPPAVSPQKSAASNTVRRNAPSLNRHLSNQPTQSQSIVALRRPKQWIQLLASTDLTRARNAQATLRSHHIDSVLAIEKTPKNTYYRLRFGPFFNRNEASKFLRWIQQSPNLGKQFADSFVVTS